MVRDMLMDGGGPTPRRWLRLLEEGMRSMGVDVGAVVVPPVVVEASVGRGVEVEVEAVLVLNWLSRLKEALLMTDGVRLRRRTEQTGRWSEAHKASQSS